MNFAKVKLINGGQHGLLAEYVESELKNGFQFDNKHTCERKLPVPSPLVKLFEKLTEHVRMICTFNEAADIEVTGVVSNASDKFIITAKVRTFDNSVFAVNTPLKQEGSEYGMFEDVIAIIKDIYTQANDYFEKKQSATAKQVVMDLFAHNPEKVNDVINAEVEDGEARRVLTQADIEQMTDGDLRPLLIAALERKGCLVMEEEAIPGMMGDANGNAVDVVQVDAVKVGDKVFPASAVLPKKDGGKHQAAKNEKMKVA